VERGGIVAIYYHRTDNAESILREGFRDGEGSYMVIGTTFSGVWLSNYPLECNEGAKGDQLLEITLPDDLDISDHEWAEEGKPYREWLVPAEVLTQHGRVRLLSADEEDQIDLWY
jgi:hypothetical protein